MIKKEQEMKKDLSERVTEEKKKDKEISKNTTEEEQINTSDWKTYRNEEYGFEFKYPENEVQFQEIQNYNPNKWRETLSVSLYFPDLLLATNDKNGYSKNYVDMTLNRGKGDKDYAVDEWIEKEDIIVSGRKAQKEFLSEKSPFPNNITKRKNYENLIEKGICDGGCYHKISIKERRE